MPIFGATLVAEPSGFPKGKNVDVRLCVHTAKVLNANLYCGKTRANKSLITPNLNTIGQAIHDIMEWGVHVQMQINIPHSWFSEKALLTSGVVNSGHSDHSDQ